MKPTRRTDLNWLVYDIHNRFFETIRPKLSGTVVDLGCGTMPYRSEILAQNCRYVGVDWTHSYHGVQPDVVSDMNVEVSLPNQSADAVISFSALEHLHQPAAMLSEAHRILKPGGALFMQVPFQWEVHEAPYDYYRFTRHGLAKLLSDAGFCDSHITADCGFWVTWILKFNYQSTRWIRGPLLLRAAMRLMLTPIWFVNQELARVLDRLDFNADETASYSVVARKAA
jgi:SAM-dependent methyltransferase